MVYPFIIVIVSDEFLKFRMIPDVRRSRINQPNKLIFIKWIIREFGVRSYVGMVTLLEGKKVINEKSFQRLYDCWQLVPHLVELV